MAYTEKFQHLADTARSQVHGVTPDAVDSLMADGAVALDIRDPDDRGALSAASLKAMGYRNAAYIDGAPSGPTHLPQSDNKETNHASVTNPPTPQSSVRDRDSDSAALRLLE